MLVDQAVRIAGREAIALDEHLALRIEQRQPGREALGVKQCREPPLSRRVDPIGIDLATRCGLERAGLDDQGARLILLAQAEAAGRNAGSVTSEPEIVRPSELPEADGSIAISGVPA